MRIVEQLQKYTVRYALKSYPLMTPKISDISCLSKLAQQFSQKVIKQFSFSLKRVELELNDKIMPKNNKFCCDFGEITKIDMYEVRSQSNCKV